MIESYQDREIGHIKGPAWGAAGMNAYSEPTGQAVTIKARVEPRSVRVLDATGAEVQTQHGVFTTTEVRIGDVLVIDGQDCTVRDGGGVPDLSGVTRYWDVTC